MAVDYYVLFPCEVRKQVSDAELLNMEKAKNRAELIVQTLRDNPGEHQNKPEAEWSVTMVQVGPNGSEEVEIRVGDLLAEAAPLERLAVHCKDCPANLQKRDFGCGAAIHYPITRQAEQWMLSRLPDDLNALPGQILLRAIHDFGFDGSSIDAARSRDDLYEAKSPPVRKWGGFFSRKRITSSQLLQMMFDVGNFQPAHAKMLAMFLGYVDETGNLSYSPVNYPQPNDDPSMAQLKTFFALTAFAGANGFEVLVDA